MSTTPIVSAPLAGGATTSTNGLPSAQSLNNMFLQLLVAQLQHQDPTSPMDPSQFVGQLAQFSELSEVTSIYHLLQQIVSPSGGGGPGGGAAPAGGSKHAAKPTALPAVAAATSALPPAASPAAAALPNFASPGISALTSKIQGVF